MKRVSIACFALAVLLAGTVTFSPVRAAEAQDSESLAVLKEWVGLAPFEKKNGKKMWEVKPFREKLQKLLGKERFDSFQKIFTKGMMTDVEQEGNLLYIFFCEYLNCPGFQTVIFVNLDNNKISACWRDASSSKGSDLWLFADGGEKALESATCSRPYRLETYTENELKK